MGQSRRFEHAVTLSARPPGADLSDSEQLFGTCQDLTLPFTPATLLFAGPLSRGELVSVMESHWSSIFGLTMSPEFLGLRGFIYFALFLISFYFGFIRK
jgi:hypothetical protein